MSIEENLTYLQKVAIKGEIAFALSTAAHDTEIKFRTYLILKEINEKYRPLVIECIKEAVTFDETIIDKIYLDILYHEVPVWLWIEEIIADIKLHLASVDASMGGTSLIKLSISKLQERKNIIESAFTQFAREAILVSPTSVEKLLDEIINDYDLEFLHTACYYLKSGCYEIENTRLEDGVSEELMSCLFDIKKILSFSTETKALKVLNKMQRTNNKISEILSTSGTPNNILKLESGSVAKDSITHEELSNYISEKIVELFEGVSNPTAETRNDTVYVVKKVFTNSGLSTDIRICKTLKEAMDFVNKVVQEYPELTRTCEFQVHTERINGREKNQWGPKQGT